MRDPAPPNDKPPRRPVAFAALGVLALWSGIALAGLGHAPAASLLGDGAPAWAADGAGLA